MTLGAPRVSIVVPLDASPVQALACLEGIAAQPPEPSFEVIVVDDASVGLESLLLRLQGDVEIVRSEHRIGFAAAARLGVQRARAATTVLIRSAAVPQVAWLAPLVAALDDPAFGLAASAGGGNRPTPLISTWSVAVRTDDMLSAELPPVDDQLVIGTLALSLSQRGLRVQEVAQSAISAPGVRTGAARRPPGEAPELTIIIPTLDASSDRIRRCLRAIAATTDVAHEIVIVDNGAPPQGFAAPVNAGLRAAATQYAVVMNDDVEPLAGWWGPLREALDGGAAVAFPLTVKGGMRTDFAAWCFALTSASMAEFAHEPGEFFDPSLVVWFQDTDLLARLVEAGCPPVMVASSQIEHGLSQTVASEDPELSAWIRTQIARDQEHFLRKHPHISLTAHTRALHSVAR